MPSPPGLGRKVTGAAAVAALLATTAILASSASSSASSASNGPAGRPPTATGGLRSAPLGPGAPVGKSHTVTLVTGDRLMVSADGRTAFFPPGGRRPHIQYKLEDVDGHLSVIPSDAATLVASGRVDRRLFDLTTLVEAGYDDGRTGQVPLIMAGSSKAGLSRRSGVSRARALPSIGATSVAVGKPQAAGLWKVLTAPGSGVRKLWLDGKRKVSLDHSVPQIGAPAAWQAGFTGKGVKVAVLDTGIDATHPDLAGRIGAVANFTADPSGDQVGHGTHVASTIAGSGAASGGSYRGVAPDATLLDGKVCEVYGCTESAVLAGMEWAAVDQAADVVNLSLGGYDTPEVDPLEEAVDRLTAQTGALFVVAAGNEGPSAGSVDSPAGAEAALAVGAVDREDKLAEFSGRGPLQGRSAIKPEVTAPGVGIVAARAADGQIGEPVGERYTRLNGTSMATPHVAGSAALLAQQHPDWTARALKAALVATANRQDGQSVFEQGAGRVDAAAAVGASVFPDQASLSLGLQRWPHDDDKPVMRELTYRNVSATPVELDLTATLKGPDGADAPAGAITLSTSRLVVPARGTAAVTVAVSTAHDGAAGAYGGQVVARTADRSLTTLVGIVKEAESYDLTVDLIDAAGNPTADAVARVTGIDNANSTVREEFTSPTGVVHVRLPRGRYLLAGFMFSAVRAGVLVQPTLELTADTTVQLDARLAKPFDLTMPDSDVRSFAAAVKFSRRDEAGRWLEGAMVGDRVDVLSSAQIGPASPAEEMVSSIDSQWAVPGRDGDFTDSAVRYAVGDSRRGAMLTGLRRTVRPAELGRLLTRIAAPPPGHSGYRGLAPVTPESQFSSGVALPITKAMTVTEYVDARDRDWFANAGDLLQTEDGLMLVSEQAWPMTRTVAAGRTYPEDWNYVVFGPDLSSAGSARRDGDLIQPYIGLFSDRARHAYFTSTDSAATRLYRNGVLVGESAEEGSLDRGVEVAPGPARFRLETTADRSSTTPFSTRVSATWSFSSDTTGKEGETLPLWVVRFRPVVGPDNSQPRSPVIVVPFEAIPTPTATVGALRKPVIEVSGDGGKTWRKAAVTAAGSRKYVAVVATPAAAKSISLRAKVADADGNTLEQTILGAYGIR